jgi:hypothetical protein
MPLPKIENHYQARTVLPEGRLAEINLLHTVALATEGQGYTDQEYAQYVPGEQANRALYGADQLGRIATREETPGGDSVGETGAVGG